MKDTVNDKAKAYSRERHRLAVINIFLTPAVLVLFIAAGIPSYIGYLSLSASPSVYIGLLLFSLFVSIVYYLVTLPVTFYSGFILEHKYSLSNQKLKDWVIRESKKGVVSFVIAVPLVFSLYGFLKYSPLYWWAYTALLWFFISIIIAKFAPILIVPLFYKYSPIKNAGLKEKLIDLISRVGFKAEGVYEINISKDTKKANAALMGLGRQKRIVLCDTLLENFNEDEIESVMGHELGHHKLKHILKLTLFSGISTVLVFYFTNMLFLRFHNIVGYELLYDFESLVLIYAIISVLNIITLPISNAFSRKQERQADLFTLQLTGNKDAFVSTMKKLAAQNLADLNPAKFYEIMLYTHPPISRRLSFAESYEGKK